MRFPHRKTSLFDAFPLLNELDESALFAILVQYCPKLNLVINQAPAALRCYETKDAYRAALGEFGFFTVFTMLRDIAAFSLGEDGEFRSDVCDDVIKNGLYVHWSGSHASIGRSNARATPDMAGERTYELRERIVGPNLPQEVHRTSVEGIIERLKRCTRSLETRDSGLGK
jgi:hypothetical protein